MLQELFKHVAGARSYFYGTLSYAAICGITHVCILAKDLKNVEEEVFERAFAPLHELSECFDISDEETVVLGRHHEEL